MRNKSQIRRLRKEHAREHEQREMRRISIPVGTFIPSYFDFQGNEYWYDETGKVIYEEGR